MKLTSTTRRLAALASASALAGGLSLAALAAPAGAATACAPGDTSCSGTGSAQATITIPLTFSFQMASGQVAAFTGTPGGPSNQATINYGATTNDSAGYTVAVQASGDLAGTGSNGVKIPAADIATWQTTQVPLQKAPGSVTQVSTAGPSTGKVNGAPGSGVFGAPDTWVDFYQFTAPGTNIPVVPADTYSATLNYLGVAK